MYVTTAEKSDKAGAMEMLSFHFSNLLGIQKIMVDGGYTVHHLPILLKQFIALKLKLLSVMNFIILKFYLNVKKFWLVTGDYGKIVSEYFILPIKSLFLPLFLFYSEDIRQDLIHIG